MVDKSGCDGLGMNKLPLDKFRLVKSYKKKKKKTVVPSNLIKTSNMFECLKEEECIFEGPAVNISFNCKKQKRSDKRKAMAVDLSGCDGLEIKKLSLDEFILVKRKRSNKKMIKNSVKIEVNDACENNLNYFSTKNLFSILEDNAVEDINSLIKILTVSKKSLKKCRKCNFKRDLAIKIL